MRLSEVEVTDDEVNVMREMGILLRALRHLDEAETVFRGLAALLPEWVVPRVELARVAIERGRFDEAERECVEVLRLRPDNLYARVHHAEVLLLQHRRDEAEAELEEVLATDPQSPHSRTARELLKWADLVCPQEGTAAGEAV